MGPAIERAWFMSVGFIRLYFQSSTDSQINGYFLSFLDYSSTVLEHRLDYQTTYNIFDIWRASSSWSRRAFSMIRHLKGSTEYMKEVSTLCSTDSVGCAFLLAGLDQ